MLRDIAARDLIEHGGAPSVTQLASKPTGGAARSGQPPRRPLARPTRSRVSTDFLLFVVISICGAAAAVVACRYATCLAISRCRAHHAGPFSGVPDGAPLASAVKRYLVASARSNRG